MRSIPRAAVGILAGTVLASTLLVAMAPAASSSMGGDMLRMINRKRETHGLRPLHVGHRITRKARVHTRHMIRRNQLFHSRTAAASERLRGISWGENVGCARSPRRLFRALMHSPEHRANILHRGFHRAGVGVLLARGRTICGHRSVWTTQIFLS